MQEDEDTENLCREYAFGSLDGVNPVPALGSPNKTLVSLLASFVGSRI
jgi:hypothetical protein